MLEVVFLPGGMFGEALTKLVDSGLTSRYLIGRSSGADVVRLVWDRVAN